MNPVSESLEVQVVVFLIVLGLFERGPRAPLGSKFAPLVALFALERQGKREMR